MARLLTERVFAAKEPVTQTFTQMRPTAMRIQTFNTSKLSISFVDFKGFWVDGRSIAFYYDASSPPVRSAAAMHDLEMGLEAVLDEHYENKDEVVFAEVEDEVVFAEVDSDAD